MISWLAPLIGVLIVLLLIYIGQRMQTRRRARRAVVIAPRERRGASARRLVRGAKKTVRAY